MKLIQQTLNEIFSLGKQEKLQKEVEAIEKLNFYDEETFETVSISPVAQVLALEQTAEQLQLGADNKTYKKIIAVKGMVIFKLLFEC